ncbi:MAG: ATP-binding protein [Solirubrobacterales bacterium]
MYSIRRSLATILIVCTVTAVIISALFVNFAIDNTFNKYVADNQEKRNERIVDYFTQVYNRDKKWTDTSGEEMQHEGYMSNYCLTLLDAGKKQIWGMNPNEIAKMNPNYFKMGSNNGEYITNTLPIKNNDQIVGYIVIGQFQPLLLSETDINFKNSINVYVAVSTLITILFCIIVSIIFSRQFSRPIKTVSETSVDLSQGNYDSKSDIRSNVVEINNLINSINILGERLKHQDTLRKRLISDISHEVRTPLNVLQNNLEAMVDGVFPVTNERLTSLNEEVIRFGKLLSNLNSLKEIEEHKDELNIENIHLDEVLDNVYNDFLINSRNNNVDLKLSYDKNRDYSIYGDKDKLRQVFFNILSNSFKFSNPGGMIQVSMDVDKEYVSVTVKDNGIGIKKGDLPYIFERLYRGDKSRNEIEGSGIGLTIVKELMMQHNAEINVESEEGKGTCLKLRFSKASKMQRD